MARKLSLLNRLNLALDSANSDRKKDLVYVSFYEVGRSCLTNSEDVFYEVVLPKTRLYIPNLRVCGASEEKVERGKELAKVLETGIVWPEPNVKGYGRKIRKAIEKEFEILRDYYRGGIDGTPVQS